MSPVVAIDAWPSCRETTSSRTPAANAISAAQGGQPGSFPDLNTGIREGSGYAQGGQPGSFPDLNTATREGSGYAQGGQPGSLPDLKTGIRERSG